jgi:hypothetical protein
MKYTIFPGSATVPVAVFGVSPDTFPFKVHGKALNFKANTSPNPHDSP